LSSNTLRFYLDGSLIEIDDCDPTQSLLQYLREDTHRVGSKEGCAEGDCGACTVVVAELVGAQNKSELQFRAVNACIQFLPTLDGKMLFTVESLKTSQGQLHPVQQSMVDYHASQCGFCTPGFIMSMFALYKSSANIDRETIDDALSGNLCRCTGYRPIIEACQHMNDYAIPTDADSLVYRSAHDRNHSVDQAEQLAIESLKKIRRSDLLTMQSKSGLYFAPASTQAFALLYEQHSDATILAGGTDVGLWVTKQLRELPKIIYLGNIAELNRIEETDTDIEIAAAVTLTDAFDRLSEDYPELNELWRRFASPPVRNAGTLVGNIANGSPIGDSMPALICIGARVKLRKGLTTRIIALQDLYLGYQQNALQAGEFIESVLIEKRDPSLLVRSYKICKRFDQDISAVCAAFSIRLDGNHVSDIRIAFGGMAATPQRATNMELKLTGQFWNEDNLRAAMGCLAEDYSPLSDMRASSHYRQQVGANLLYRFYLETRQHEPLAANAVNVFLVS